MLTSPSNQYLRPEYLTPLPTTLDAKKSPLALLAQTCSQIGVDTPNSKLLQSSEKSSNKSSSSSATPSKNESSSKDKSLQSSSTLNDHYKSSGNSNKHFEPSNNNHNATPRDKSRSPEERSSSSSIGSNHSSGRVRTPQASKTNGLGRCGSNQSASSPRASPSSSESNKTPAASNDPNTNQNPSERGTPNTNKSSSDRGSPSTPNNNNNNNNNNTKTAFTPNILTSSSDPAIKDLPLGTFKPGVHPVNPAFLGASTYPGFPSPMDLMMSQHHHALKTAGLSPYLGYGRLKPDSLPQTVCRDPYCTGCGVSAHLFGTGNGGAKSNSSSACPAGCTQCDHAKNSPPVTTSSYLGAAYAHAQLAALAAASHLPYVCNWISGDAAYCGKRFSSSEELLAHLRNHTSMAVSESNQALGMHPLLHRTYPTPPLSPLATARYHPYSKPSPLLPPSLGGASLSGFPMSHPGLSPYLPPYSLYGPRLGTSPGMHP